MKNLYKVMNKNGVTLCFQAAKTATQAVEFAKMYGHKGAATAEFVREE